MLSDFLHWLHQHLLPCPFKWLTGIDCPGCGFQRSLLALFRGDLAGSFELYPATVPFLALLITAAMHKWLGLDRKGNFLKVLAFFTGGLMVVSYFLKIYRMPVLP